MSQRKDNCFILDGGAVKCFACGDKYNPFDPSDAGDPVKSVSAVMLGKQYKEFSKMHRKCGPPGPDAFKHPASYASPMAWLRGDDTGMSSRAICFVLGKSGKAPDYGWGANTPHDPSDFGRCFRLLAAFPEWRERLPDVAAWFPNWTPFVTAWPELEALWNEESQREDGNAPKLYARMQELTRLAYPARMP